MKNIDPWFMMHTIDELLRLKELLVEREMNAVSCRTDRDWKRAHAAQEAFENKYGEVKDMLTAG